MHAVTLLLLFSLLSCLSSAGPSPSQSRRSNDGTVVNLRIEGLVTTIFEGPVFTRGHNVTTASGGTHECNGLNDAANPTPGPTATSALDSAAHHAGFTFDGTFDTEFDDFLITRIGLDTQTSTDFWGLLVNFQFAEVGGCQQEVRLDDQVLWAFNAFNANAFLKLTGPSVVKEGETATFAVTDGLTGDAVQGASIGGETTDANGHAVVMFKTPGAHTFKATKESTIRSNELVVLVV